MSGLYLSSAEAISLVAWGREDAIFEQIPSEADLRQRIRGNWGKEVLLYQPFDQRGGERRHQHVLAARRTLLRCQWRKRHGRLTAARWQHLGPTQAKARLGVWTHALRAADPESRRWIRMFVRHSRQTITDVGAKLRIDLRPLYEMRATRAEAMDVAIRCITSAAAAAEITLIGRPIRPGGGEGGGAHERIPGLFFLNQWNTITPEGRAGCDADAPLGEQRAVRSEWRDLRMLRSDFMFWISLKATPLAGDGTSEPRSAATGPVTGRDSRPEPTNPAVREWFRSRVADWPDEQPAPSESKDWHAITSFFAPGLSRAEFRLVRKDETPAAWRKQGPRPSWGEAKQSAAQSANLPTQI
jgi:hypothetical protein